MKIRIKEAFDPSLPQWVKGYLEANSQRFSGIDLANAKYRDVTSTVSNKELSAAQKDWPDWGNFIIRGIDDGGKEFIFVPCTWTGERVLYKNQLRDLDKAAGRWLLDHAEEIGRLEFDREGLLNLRTQRGKDKEGSNWNRDKVKQRKDRWGDWVTGDWSGNFDKSGYPITRLEKYKIMLGAMDLEKYEDVLDEAYDLYAQLQGCAPLVRGNDYKKRAFVEVTQRFLDKFETLDRYYRMYPDGNYYATQLKRDLYDFRGFNNSIAEFIDHLMMDDMDDDYYKKIAG